ncbi:MAG: glycosyltransferase family 9 protein [Phycisphaerae bacterium]|nr:glycosyltransferase family 9 protein [Phycisphaerae bacterium]
MLRRNVLIFHSGALGDFVLSWPLAMALGRLYPQSRIICVCASQKGRLLERALRLESQDVENGWSALFAPDAAVTDPIARTLSGAHTICSFVAAADSCWAKNVRRLAPEAAAVFIDPVLPPKFTRHATDHLVDQLAGQPVIATAVGQLLRSIAERGTGLPNNMCGSMIIHPGAGSPAKCWPLDCFRKVATGRDVKWIIGEVEAERWSDAERAEATQPKTLVELFDILRGASLYVGNDSGPAHLAGILGVQTIALFGPSNPANWRPLGPRVKTIHRPSIDQITVDDVLAQIDLKNYPRRHGEKHGE